jgi:hypothetical protein
VSGRTFLFFTSSYKTSDFMAGGLMLWWEERRHDLPEVKRLFINYPPYHSKYNAIERHWAGLEKSWNGYLLDSVSCVLNRAGNFAWNWTGYRCMTFQSPH